MSIGLSLTFQALILKSPRLLQHGSCPSCRNVFLHLPPEEEYESSDGGEYVPPEEGEEDDDYNMSDWDTAELYSSESDDDVEDLPVPEASTSSADITWLSYDDNDDADVEDLPRDEAEDTYMTDPESYDGGLTDGGDTLSSEGEPRDISQDDIGKSLTTSQCGLH